MSEAKELRKRGNSQRVASLENLEQVVVSFLLFICPANSSTRVKPENREIID